MTDAEMKDRQEFAYEAAVRMRDRFLSQEVWEQHGRQPARRRADRAARPDPRPLPADAVLQDRAQLQEARPARPQRQRGCATASRRWASSSSRTSRTPARSTSSSSCRRRGVRLDLVTEFSISRMWVTRSILRRRVTRWRWLVPKTSQNCNVPDGDGRRKRSYGAGDGCGEWRPRHLVGVAGHLESKSVRAVLGAAIAAVLGPRRPARRAGRRRVRAVRRPRVRPGELTLAVTERLGIHEMVGIDSSAAMLARARDLVGPADDRLRFARGDIAQWTARGDHDLVLANASLQWVPDHPRCSPGGGQRSPRAASSPCRCRPTPTTRRTVVATRSPPPSRSCRRWAAMPPADPVAANVLDPAQYATVLDHLGAARQHVRLQVYGHHLAVVGERRRVGEGHDAHPVRQRCSPTSCTTGSSTRTASACSTPSATARRTSTPSSAS